MTNAEFIESRKINGVYVLVKDIFEDPQTASMQRGRYTSYEDGTGFGFGWCSFKNTPFIKCVELPYQSNGIQVFGLLIED